ncbi:MAG: metallophosphoesterase [Eubacteriales bacterium]|nr:metallophosphoesterase [Eubacteriales bacterium]
MRYYISDLHFFSERLNDNMDCRGFADAKEMNEVMIRKWNEKVKPKDEVVIIGDFSMGSGEETNELLKRLNGLLYLIIGNHDYKYLESPAFHSERFVWIKHYAEMKDNKRKVVLSHYPIFCYNGQYRRNKNGYPSTYMLYGHVHDSQDEYLVRQFKETTRNTLYQSRFDTEPKPIPCNMLNCFCMYSDYTPLTLDEWIQNHKERGAL